MSRLRDGTFEAYTMREGLPDGHVLALHEDRDGVLWIGTGGGLARFDGERFLEEDLGRFTPGMAVWSIASDADGALMLTTDAGVLIWDGSRLTSITEAHGLPTGAVRARRVPADAVRRR